jgi:hypothetical protein
MFSNNSGIRILKQIVAQHVNDPGFDNTWREIVAKFSKWEPAMGDTSDLNVRLEFLQRLCAAFPYAELYRHKAIVDVLLADSGARDIGHMFKCQLPDRRTETAKIVNREITARFGILYTLETLEGFRFTKEFFD